MAIKVKTPSSSPASDRKSKRRRLRRRIFITSGTIIGALLLIVLLLPIWASTDRGRAFVLDQINKRLDGTLDCDDWRLNWFRSIKLEGVTLTDDNGRQVFQCREIRTDMTLLSYVLGSHALGTMTLLDPVADIHKYADGSTDIDRVFAHDGPAFLGFIQTWRHALSGLIRIDHGDVTLSASGAGAPLHFSNIRIEIPVASPQAPIHISIHAGDPAGSEVLFAEGDFPPLDTWSQNPAALLQNMTFHAENLPVATLARWLKLDAGWDAVIGPSLNSLRLNTTPAARASIAQLTISGATGSIAARLQLESNDGHLIISMPSPDFYLLFQGRMAEPLAARLEYVNPLFGQCVPGEGAVRATVDSARLDVNSPQTAAASVQVVCSKVQLRPGGFLGQIVSLATQGQQSNASSGPDPVDIPPFRVQIGGEQIACDDFTVALPPSRAINFSGFTGMDGSLHLHLNLKLDDFMTQHNSLGSGTLECPVSGTVDAPKLSAP